jgi:hypothetical protein
MIAFRINSSNEQVMTDLMREQIANVLADAELLRASGNAKAAERMTKVAVRLRKRLDHHMTTRDAQVDKWEAQTLDAFVAALELMAGESSDATGLKLPSGYAMAGTSCAPSAPQYGDAPSERPSDAALSLIGSQCSGAADREEQE